MRNVRKLGGYLQTAWSIIGLTILILLGIESALIVVTGAARTTPLETRATADGYADADWVRGYYQEHELARALTWTPYVYWKSKPFAGSYINIDERGIRKTWNTEVSQAEDASGIIEVFMFGGSTMWGSGVPDDYTIASIVSRLLTQQAGLSVHVTNFGESGYVSTQEVIALMRELQWGNVPDVVVFYDGWNDVHSALQNGEAGLPQNERNRFKEFNLLNPYVKGWRGRLFKHSLLMFARHSVTAQTLLSFSRRSDWTEPRATSPENVDALERLSDGVVGVYSQNMRLVTHLGEAYGFKALFFWQPVIFSKRHLTRYERERAKEVEYARSLFLEVYSRMEAELSTREEFNDLSDAFSEDDRPYFTDYAHLTGAGNAVVAQRMLAPTAQAITQASGQGG